jgi:hypothetical protein
MRQSGQGIRIWMGISVALMLVGAFGPWVKALGTSVNGTDGSNDGWLVVAAAGIGGLLFFVLRERRQAGVWPLLGGLGGLAVTVHDRSNVQNAINGNALASALVQVGWGLNLALGASISMTVAAVVYLIAFRRPPLVTPAPAPPPPIATETPAGQPPVAPTSPPE